MTFLREKTTSSLTNGWLVTHVFVVQDSLADTTHTTDTQAPLTQLTTADTPGTACKTGRGTGRDGRMDAMRCDSHTWMDGWINGCVWYEGRHDSMNE
mmetsp:Transcript_11133/g.32248  ORF Transcript_11133/g.32248 Transcript_11133/m.32248 type:complete len:97 (+) Transcript_11133:181-471(+)